MTEKIIEILRQINPYEEIDEESRLIEDAILDSLTLVVLINEIERVFNIRIPEDRLQPEFFGSVSAIAALLGELV